MKTLGIIGGIGPESTVEYYRKIIAAYRQQVPDGSYPPIQINSINMTEMLNLIGTNRFPEVAQFLSMEIEKLAAANADVALLASNTPHIVFDTINQQSPIPLISIVEATAEHVVDTKLNRVGLFGTRFTMQGGFYAQVLSKNNIDLVLPTSAEQELIHDKYMGELLFGNIKAETHDQILKIVSRMIEEDNIQGLILGGTELPLLFPQSHYLGIPFFDTTEIHVAQAISWILRT